MTALRYAFLVRHWLFAGGADHLPVDWMDRAFAYGLTLVVLSALVFILTALTLALALAVL